MRYSGRNNLVHGVVRLESGERDLPSIAETVKQHNQAYKMAFDLGWGDQTFVPRDLSNLVYHEVRHELPSLPSALVGSAIMQAAYYLARARKDTLVATPSATDYPVHVRYPNTAVSVRSARRGRGVITLATIVGRIRIPVIPSAELDDFFLRLTIFNADLRDGDDGYYYLYMRMKDPIRPASTTALYTDPSVVFKTHTLEPDRGPEPDPEEDEVEAYPELEPTSQPQLEPVWVPTHKATESPRYDDLLVRARENGRRNREYLASLGNW